MPSVVCLDEVWELTGFDLDGEERIHIPGKVPGHVHVDLEREGLIPPMFWRDNADACQWVENWTWRYCTTLYIDDDDNLSWAELVFMGLDTFAEIRLNGTVIGHTANMFIPHCFEVSNQLRPGENALEVVFTPYHQHIMGKRLDYPAAFDTHDRVHVRRMQCTFHWDWVNRFVSAGIWRPVRLYMFNGAKLDDLYITTTLIEEDYAEIAISIVTTRRTSGKLIVHLTILGPDDDLAWEWDEPLTNDKTLINMNITEPELWWPNGYGSQSLYRCIATLLVDGQEVDGKAVDFGIRTVAVEQLVDQPGSPEEARTLALRKRYPEQDRNGEAPGSSFTLVVNGQRIFARGGNWVPADPLPGRMAGTHYRRLVWLAKEANLNLLRCWGGGIYESEVFWKMCDACGVMVTQDFAMACAWYPEDDPDFIEVMRAEIPAAIRMLRNHPSLVWWSGDNENGMNHDADDPHFPAVPSS